MITLYIFGPNMGLPDASPFCIKAEVLLKMSGLPYRLDLKGFGKAPKGKLPYIDDEGTIIADSTHIRMYLEGRRGIDFDRGYDAVQRAQGWAAEKMCEEHLYRAIVNDRWLKDENFAKGPAHFFKAVPAPIRPLVTALIRRKQRNAGKAQGMGRHTDAEIDALGIKDIDALAAMLGSKPYFLGDTASGTDAAVFGFVATASAAAFDTPIPVRARGHMNLMAYKARMMKEFFPGFG